VSYRIAASLEERAGVLRGTQVLLYRNQSPDTLRSISFHLYLNAFRPGSRWVTADSAEGLHRYDELPDPLYGFNHVSRVEIDGTPVDPIWPLAPDSTIVRFALPRPLAPADSIEVTMLWDARPPFPPRRSGRWGRHFDFGQWYPRVVVYDRHGWNEQPLLPSGEFYGEFGTYLVQLDVAADQVVGATGVPLCGDPGWERARRPSGQPVTFDRDWYDEPRDPVAGVVLADSTACGASAPGRKTIIWYAEDVHHFALSLNPDYRYEEGDILERPVRVLYQPGDERTWGAGLVTRRTETALAWLAELFGPYPWPQLTNVHRLEGGATEYPMMVHDGSPGMGLILHEVGHNYLMGILANNEWREGWLDEGFTNFQARWFFETQGVRGGYESLERRVIDWDLDGLSEPVSQPGHRFRDAATYRAMTYDKGELFFHQLRAIFGEETMRRVLRRYYEAYEFRHVDEAALRSVAEDVAGQDLSTFFRQSLHETVLYDYRVAGARREQLSDGRWRTRVDVRRNAAGEFPVEVWVFAEGDTARAGASGRGDQEWVEITTLTRPRKVSIDPRGVSHDWNLLNNQEHFGFRSSMLLLQGDRPLDHYVDGYFTQRTARDRLTVGWAPLAWYNDAGGWTFGLRARGDYLGRFEGHTLAVTQSTGWGPDGGRNDLDARLVLQNPVGLRAPGLGQRLALASVEGRLAAAVEVEKSFRRSLADRSERTLGISLAWLATRTRQYLDPRFYDDAGTIELSGTLRLRTRANGWQLALEGLLAGGWMYRDRDAAPAGAGPDQPYGRLTLTTSARKQLVGPLRIAGRAYVGATLAGDDLVRQRLVYVAGAGPYERFDNPFLRSRGSILTREGVYYHEPGGAGVRALQPTTAASQAYGLSLELEIDLLRGDRAFGRRVAVGLFADAALADGDLDEGGANRILGIADGGIGLRADHRIGQTSFQTRFDFPFWVSRPDLAHDDGPGGSAFGFRWSLSFVPAI
jgi:hypothetical protein